MPSKPESMLVIPLQSEPEIAQQVGFVIGQYQILEMLYAQLLEALSNTDQHTARTLILEMTPRRRREILKKLCEEKLPDDPRRKSLIKFLDVDARSITNRRNMYAHHIYAAGGRAGVITLMDPATTDVHSITAKSVAADVKDIATRLAKFQVLVLDLLSFSTSTPEE